MTAADDPVPEPADDRAAGPGRPGTTAPLADLRAEIEAIDQQLIAGIAARMAVARRIRAAKQASGQPILDPAREAAVVARAAERARAFGLPEEPIRQLYWKLMALARQVQLDGE